MSTFTLMRLYMRMQKVPRLPIPHIGNAGILYSAPLIDLHREALKEDAINTSEHPEVSGTKAKAKLVPKGAIGSYRHYSTTSVEDINIKKVEKERAGKKSKLKTPETVKIMLVSETGSLSTVTLLEADKIAKKRGLILQLVENEQEKPVQTEKEVYKLVSKTDLMKDEDEPSSKSEATRKEKEMKQVMLNSNIGEHDLQAKVRSMIKWIQKGHRVKVAIGQAGDKGDGESVYSTIEAAVKEVQGEIQQKIKKANQIRFYIGPLKTPKSKS